jgi:hypothetical protein
MLASLTGAGGVVSRGTRPPEPAPPPLRLLSPITPPPPRGRLRPPPLRADPAAGAAGRRRPRRPAACVRAAGVAGPGCGVAQGADFSAGGLGPSASGACALPALSLGRCRPPGAHRLARARLEPAAVRPGHSAGRPAAPGRRPSHVGPGSARVGTAGLGPSWAKQPPAAAPGAHPVRSVRRWLRGRPAHAEHVPPCSS